MLIDNEGKHKRKTIKDRGVIFGTKNNDRKLYCPVASEKQFYVFPRSFIILNKKVQEHCSWLNFANISLLLIIMLISCFFSSQLQERFQATIFTFIVLYYFFFFFCFQLEDRFQTTIFTSIILYLFLILPSAWGPISNYYIHFHRSFFSSFSPFSLRTDFKLPYSLSSFLGPLNAKTILNSRQQISSTVINDGPFK